MAGRRKQEAGGVAQSQETALEIGSDLNLAAEALREVPLDVSLVPVDLDIEVGRKEENGGEHGPVLTHPEALDGRERQVSLLVLDRRSLVVEEPSDLRGGEGGRRWTDCGGNRFRAGDKDRTRLDRTARNECTHPSVIGGQGLESEATLKVDLGGTVGAEGDELLVVCCRGRTAVVAGSVN